MDFLLRDYQQKFIDDVRNEFKSGVKKVCGVAPCGAGKTVMTGWMIKETLNRNKRSIFFVHRKELIEQTANTFCRLNIPFGVISAGNKPNYNLPVQIASVQTLVNRLSEVPTPDFLICDECHHILADTYRTIIDHWQDAFLLGVTATPQRTGGVRLGDVFDSLVLAPNVKELIELGNLAPFRYFAPDLQLSLEKLRVQRGDFVSSESAALMSNAKILANVISEYNAHANGKSAICYCVNVEHSKLTADRFNAAGIPAAHVDGDTPKDSRAQIVRDFRNGTFKVLCNAELFGEGFDVPNMDAVILARPTKSLTLFIQQAMRPLRPDPNNPDKVATIIDCVDNFSRFGLPDRNHNWSLEPNEEKQPQLPPMKVCPECNEVVPFGTRICACGYEFFSNEVNEANLSTSEIPNNFMYYWNIKEKRGYKDYWAVINFLQNDAKSISDIIAVRNFMGYKKGWENYQLKFLKKSKQ